MKKFTTFRTLLVALMALGATSAWADEWSIDFAAIGANYPDKTGVTISTTVATIGGTDMGTCTVGEEALNANFVLQTGTTWLIRQANGLYQGNGGGRAMGMLGCTAGQTITIVGTGNPNPSTNATLKSQDGNTYVYTVTADGDVKFTPARYLYFTSVSVANPSATAVEYTVKYVDEEGTELKASTKGEGEPDASITPTDTEKASFKNEAGTIKYIYMSDDSEGKTIASDGSTVVTITFREAETYTYNVTDNLGNNLADGSAFEGDDVYFYIPYYVFKDDKFYKDPSLSSGTLSYGQGKISAIAANTEITVTYTEEENTNVVFFSEAENLSDITAYEDVNINGRMSNGKVGYYETQTTIVNLPAGIYTITSSSRYGNTTFYAGETEVMTVSSSGAVTTTTSNPFTLTAATDIQIGIGDTKNYFDYIIIRKTGDVPENVTVTVTDAGWATFYTDYALDFSGVTGLTAYTATLSESTVTLTEVTSVTAGTGVVLKGEANTYEIPVIDGSDTAKGDLKGSTTTAKEADGKQYVLIMNSGNAQFTKATSGSIAAGKAYLEKAESESRILNVVFAGEATGIKAIETAQANGNIYNMAGQRVAAPQKGLFIMNGKKVIIK